MMDHEAGRNPGDWRLHAREGERKMSGTTAGLCASCTHAQPITSSKGSTFIRCNLSLRDPRFPRYPTLPVLRCSGYQESPSAREPFPHDPDE